MWHKLPFEAQSKFLAPAAHEAAQLAGGQKHCLSGHELEKLLLSSVDHLFEDSLDEYGLTWEQAESRLVEAPATAYYHPRTENPTVESSAKSSTNSGLKVN